MLTLSTLIIEMYYDSIFNVKDAKISQSIINVNPHCSLIIVPICSAI